MSKVLVTGSAGFIGFHLCQLLLDEGFTVVGFDGMTSYYDVTLKQRRHQILLESERFSAIEGMLEDFDVLHELCLRERPQVIVHLAAQAGVRYSLENPRAYLDANLVGSFNVMECARELAVEHLLMASTSSVYGGNAQMPYSEHHKADLPLTFYAATKKANEMMAHSYAHLYGIPCTGLRFFTVYGPWGRPDMAPMLFARAIRAGEPIKVFNHGRHSRSFTYIDDIIEGVIRALDRPAQPNPEWDGAHPDPATSTAPYRIYNIGHERPVQLLHFIELLEQAFGSKAVMEMLPLQPGDVPDTEADTSELIRATGYTPQVAIEEGVARFARWHLDYYPDVSLIPKHA